eukprot:m.1664277 g.1664277  ORF g.1664277 m.1664277 type:complete len:67 (+) comp138801_c0_seq1:2-202(+)
MSPVMAPGDARRNHHPSATITRRNHHPTATITRQRGAALHILPRARKYRDRQCIGDDEERCARIGE